VFQNYALYPHMTVAENPRIPLRLRGAKHAEIKREAAPLDAGRTEPAHRGMSRRPARRVESQWRSVVRTPALTVVNVLATASATS
jgi:ABC-type ATPase involved in cell division